MTADCKELTEFLDNEEAAKELVSLPCSTWTLILVNCKLDLFISFIKHLYPLKVIEKIRLSTVQQAGIEWLTHSNGDFQYEENFNESAVRQSFKADRSPSASV